MNTATTATACRGGLFLKGALARAAGLALGERGVRRPGLRRSAGQGGDPDLDVGGPPLLDTFTRSPRPLRLLDPLNKPIRPTLRESGRRALAAFGQAGGTISILRVMTHASVRPARRRLQVQTGASRRRDGLPLARARGHSV
jgi:hypothetical protein